MCEKFKHHKKKCFNPERRHKIDIEKHILEGDYTIIPYGKEDETWMVITCEYCGRDNLYCEFLSEENE